jgi:hypothetical protein
MTNMAEDCPHDLKTTLLEVFLGPFKRMLQNEVVFVLVLVLASGLGGLYWAACKLEAFATTQIPKHIELLNKGTETVVEKFTTGNEKMVTQFREEQEISRKHYLELRVEDEKNADRLERLTLGKKTAGGGVSPVTEVSP